MRSVASARLILSILLLHLTLLSSAQTNDQDPRLTSSDPEERIDALQQLAQEGPLERTMPAFIRALSDGDLYVREKALEVVSGLGSHGQLAEPKLLEMLASSNTAERAMVINALAHISKGTPESISAISSHSSSPDRKVREAVMEALSSAANSKCPTVETLLRYSALTPSERIELLRDIASKACSRRDAKPVVLSSLSSTDSGVTSAGAAALRWLSLENAAEIAAVRAAAEDTDPDVRSAVAFSLRNDNIDDIGEVLHICLTDHDAQVRSIAADSLGAIDAPSVGLLDYFVIGLRDNSDAVRLATLKSIAAHFKGKNEAVETDAPTAGLILALASRDPAADIRVAGLAATSALVVEAPALKVLMEGVSDKNPKIRIAAVSALTRYASLFSSDRIYGPDDEKKEDPNEPKRFFRIFIDGLSDGNSSLRAASAEAVGRMATDSNPPYENKGTEDEANILTKELIKCMQDSDLGVRRACVSALGNVLERSSAARVIFSKQAPYSALEDILMSGDGSLGVSALTVLSHDMDSPVTIELVTKTLSNKNTDIRHMAAVVLGDIYFKTLEIEVFLKLRGIDMETLTIRPIEGKDALDQMPRKLHAIQALADYYTSEPSLDFRVQVLHSLSGFAGQTSKLLHDFDRLQSVNSPELERTILHVNSQLGDLLARLSSVAVGAAKDPNSRVRSGGLRLVAAINTESPDFFAAVKAALSDEDPEVRESALLASRAVCCTSDVAPEILNSLTKALHDPDLGVRLQAGRSIIALGDIDGVREALAASDSAVREQAITSLDRHYDLISKMFPELVELVQDRDRHVSLAAIEVLEKVSDGVKPAPTAVLDAALDGDKKVRSAALETIQAWNPEAPTSIAVLGKALSDKDELVRYEALEGITAAGPLAEPALPDLLAMLKRHPNEASVLYAIGYMHSAAAPALDTLVQLVTTADPGDIRDAAIADIGYIGKKAVPVIPLLLDTVHDEHAATAVASALHSMGVSAETSLRSIAQSREPRAKQAVLVIAQLEKQWPRRIIQVTLTNGQTRTLHIGRYDSVVFLATWCGYSKLLKEFLVSDLGRQITESANITYLFGDEWPDVREHLKQSLKRQGDWSPGTEAASAFSPSAHSCGRYVSVSLSLLHLAHSSEEMRNNPAA